jgi:hypothetical protein
VREFKAKFGGRLVNYGRHVRVHSPGRLRVSTIAYSLYQHLPRGSAADADADAIS